jgi:hypothetical protein
LQVEQKATGYRKIDESLLKSNKYGLLSLRYHALFIFMHVKVELKRTLRQTSNEKNTVEASCTTPFIDMLCTLGQVYPITLLSLHWGVAISCR